MALQPGSRLGPYEITRLLGAGGMGEVYRARDTKLNRDVALKVLPDSFANDTERLARFTREAQTLASLNHPNIAHIHGLEESGGVRALVMELVEGEDLSQRIAHGPIPVDEALPIAKQIAEALEAAHEQAIIHRDLKPANIKVRADGTVKVLDFGLAKALDPIVRASVNVTASPTITSPAMMTGVGVLLGTAAYMSPEQARGKTVDKRSDIWAFGCVLYEMLTGRRTFEGEDISETLAAVLRAEPDWTALPHDAPPSVKALLEGCLTRDRRQRIADISAVLFVLTHRQKFDAPVVNSAAPLSPRTSRWRRMAPAVAAGIIGAVAAGYAAWALKPPPALPVTRFSVILPNDEQFTGTGRHLVAVSPDGTRIVYAANDRLYVRAIDEIDSVPLRGTEGAGGVTSPRLPFFSLDGQWVGFWAAGQLKKVAVNGGAPVTLSGIDAPLGASWTSDDTIVYAAGAGGIWRVSSNGGQPENIIKLETGERAASPQVLPDGRTILFALTSAAQSAAQWDQAQIVAQSLDTGTRTTLINGGSDPRYLPTGHIIYAVRGTLFAVPVDVSTYQALAGPVPIVEQIGGVAVNGVTHYAVSPNGTLVFIPGVVAQVARRTLVWVDRQGREEPIGAPARPYVYPRLSPDGTRMALDIVEDNRDIWIWDLVRGTLTRLTSDAAVDRVPVWTPDGRRVVFSSDRGGMSNLYWQTANGTEEAERLLQSPNVHIPFTVTPDGRHVVFRENMAIGVMAGVSTTLMMIALGTTGPVQPLFKNAFVTDNAEVSPDGRWIAYESNASGRDEIYVRPFPDVDRDQWQVSTAGGEEALWAPNGRELFYRAPNGALMGVSVEAGSVFNGGGPRQILEAGYYDGETTAVWRTYDVSRDAQQFLMIKNAELTQQRQAVQQIVVVQNWTEELKRLVSTN